jgi:hypothetical protein
VTAPDHGRDAVGLDNPVYTALTGVQSRFAQSCGQVVRYAADVAPFLALPRKPSARDWVDAADLVALGTYVGVQRHGVEPPEHWKLVREFEVIQMIEAKTTWTVCRRSRGGLARSG